MSKFIDKPKKISETGKEPFELENVLGIGYLIITQGGLILINLRDSNDIGEAKSLLSECMWFDDERVHAEMTKYHEDESRDIYGRYVDDELVGIIGLILGSIGEVELKHIAIKQDFRGKGFGRQLVNEYIQVNNIVKMKAETDKDAIGFYTKLGFTIKSLGEKYPGVERFECILTTRWL